MVMIVDGNANNEGYLRQGAKASVVTTYLANGKSQNCSYGAYLVTFSGSLNLQFENHESRVRDSQLHSSGPMGIDQRADSWKSMPRWCLKVIRH
jgi:hypothetical protein